MEYWLAAVEEGSFGRAARRMHVSQPSLSQQVKVLEAQLGGELCERLPEGVRLTPAGREFLPHARDVIDASRRAVRAARAALEGNGGGLEIATVRSIAAGILPDLVHTWRQRFPAAPVRLHEFTHRRLAEDSVGDGGADLGIGPPPPGWRGPVHRLGWEELVVILSPDDAEASGAAIRLDALRERDWVMFDPENGMSDLIAGACLTARDPFTPRPAVYTSQVETATRLAAAGVGPTLVPANVVPADLRGRMLPCLPAVGRELAVYGRGKLSPPATAFLELMSEVSWPQPPTDAVVID
ncbi:MAG: LysR family transcriptional regulator [Actinobacteria bacterium]|nr:LysR family transcriptional regulator [Actinomycetota bacterium]